MIDFEGYISNLVVRGVSAVGLAKASEDSEYKFSVLAHWGRGKMDAILQTDIFKRIFLNENIWIPIKISLKFVPNVSINNIPTLVQIMAWRHPGDKPLSQPMMVNLPTHICVTQP